LLALNIRYLVMNLTFLVSNRTKLQVHGVIITNVLAPWYAQHFTGIGRVVG
jgi:hypothetical protein